ncbi:MAG: dihydroorotate dehydrogenase [Actinobacteria bacterium]|nr:dihydroorotate dehydrogenase [Actinomycetota bacterium]MCG2789803.1 dihydroorotate dehydrogenase [Actinomycetes bacterium]
MTENISESAPDLSINLGRIKLKNPVITCSGTFASGIEYNQFYNISNLGAVTTKSFSLNKRLGNSPPRLCETAGGMLNAIGLANEGIYYFINEQLPVLKNLQVSIILSIFGEDNNEFLRIAKEVNSIKDDIVAVEMNLSCPNVDKGGIAFCSMPDHVESLINSVREILDIPLIAKLSPNNDNFIETAAKARNGGAEAISLVNTVIGTAIDIDNFKPKLGNIFGGLSGPAIKPIALAKVMQLARENILPIIGMGGIFYWQDAVEFMIAGASAVGIGTLNFVEVDAGEKILEGISNYLLEKNINNLGEIIGKVFKKW